MRWILESSSNAVPARQAEDVQSAKPWTITYTDGETEEFNFPEPTVLFLHDDGDDADGDAAARPAPGS